jgi:hypothetical protein
MKLCADFAPKRGGFNPNAVQAKRSGHFYRRSGKKSRVV